MYIQHATKVVRYGRSFAARMYTKTSTVRELDYFARLDTGFRSDLLWWHTFVERWNRLSLLRENLWSAPADHQIQTDASGTWECGASFQRE